MTLPTRRGFLGALAAPALLADAGRPPNVILVLTDDQGYGDLGCLGNDALATPNLDRLHSQSTRLTDFHVCPTCAPTRSALLTGRNNNRTGVWHTIMGRSLLHRNEVTMADVFAGAGYRTGMFGKWHLGDSYPYRPHNRGFQDTLTFGGGAIGDVPDYWGNSYFNDTYRRNGKPEKFEGYCTDVWFREALRFIESNRRQPFFCYLPLNATHEPYRVPERYSAPYKSRGLPSPLPEFYGMAANIDENMGVLMRKLDEFGLTENTLLIFMTDNGSSAGSRYFNAGMRGYKGSEYDGGHRAPCFLRLPGRLPAGRDVSRLTAHFDILPTLIELCGLKAPEVAFDGRSLVPLLRGDAASWPERALVVDSQRVDEPVKWRRSAVMTDRLRLVNGAELYDIHADPGQSRNIAGGHADEVGRLRAVYERWWADIEPSFREPTNLLLGSDKENPVWLNCHDIRGAVIWRQEAIEAGLPADGYWAVDVERDGLYEFRLRRWPAEVHRPISEKLSARRQVMPDRPATPIDGVSSARLKIADADVTVPTPPGAEEVRVRLPLRAGPTRAQAWFNQNQDFGASHGVYYMGVERIG